MRFRETPSPSLLHTNTPAWNRQKSPQKITSDVTPIADSSSSAPPLPVLLPPALQLLTQSPVSRPLLQLPALANPPLRHSPPAIRFPRVSCRPPQRSPIRRNAAWSQFPALKSKPGLSDDFLTSLEELPSANPGIDDGIGYALGVYGLAGGGTFGLPAGLG
jgi:hypothetical protein